MTELQSLIINQRTDVALALKHMLHYLHIFAEPQILDIIPADFGMLKIPDLVLMDAKNFSLIQQAPATWHQTKWIVMAKHETDVADALFAGAQHFVMYDDDPEQLPATVLEVMKQDKRASLSKIIQRIKQHYSGEEPTGEDTYQLTSKERKILLLMRQGVYLKAIAQQTGNSYETIRTHVKHIYRKLHVVSASEAMLKAMKMKL
jgi:DNA-binding NarL/FixJ family response regulator